jgi:hypothetical protein
MNNSLKILVVTDSIDVNDSSGSKGRVALIYNLKRCGFNLKVLHYTRRAIHLDDVECIKIKERRSNILYVIGKLLVLFKRYAKVALVHFFEKRIGFSFLFLNDSYSIQKAIKMENPENYDWVLTLSKGASFRPHHALLNVPKWHNKWLAYVHDPYPFQCYPPPYEWNMPGYKQKERFFKEVTENARYIFFPSGLLQEWMASFFTAIKGKGVIIPHQLDETNSSNRPLPDFFLKGGFTLLHTGNLMKQRLPQPLVEGFTLFLEQNPEAKANAQLLLIGPSGYHKRYLDEVRNEILQLYVSEGYVNYEEVQSLQERAVVNVIIEADAEISPFLPGKFPHCVQANTPILHLGPKNSETVRLLGYKYPYSVANKHSEEIAVVIQKLYKEWKLNPKAFQLNRPDLKDYISPNYLARQIQRLGNID